MNHASGGALPTILHGKGMPEADTSAGTRTQHTARTGRGQLPSTIPPTPLLNTPPPGDSVLSRVVNWAIDTPALYGAMKVLAKNVSHIRQPGGHDAGRQGEERGVIVRVSESRKGGGWQMAMGARSMKCRRQGGRRQGCRPQGGAAHRVSMQFGIRGMAHGTHWGGIR